MKSIKTCSTIIDMAKMNQCTCHYCIESKGIKGEGGVLPLNFTVLIVCPVCGRINQF